MLIRRPCNVAHAGHAVRNGQGARGHAMSGSSRSRGGSAPTRIEYVRARVAGQSAGVCELGDCSSVIPGESVCGACRSSSYAHSSRHPNSSSSSCTGEKLWWCPTARRPSCRRRRFAAATPTNRAPAQHSTAPTATAVAALSSPPPLAPSPFRARMSAVGAAVGGAVGDVGDNVSTE